MDRFTDDRYNRWSFRYSCYIDIQSSASRSNRPSDSNVDLVLDFIKEKTNNFLELHSVKRCKSMGYVNCLSSNSAKQAVLLFNNTIIHECKLVCKFRDLLEVPNGWLGCPNQANALIDGKL